MSGRLAEIRRHPIKGVGWEALDAIDLAPGAWPPDDRLWAITHGASAFDPDAPVWVPRKNFLVVALSPRLAQVRARWDGARLSLAHPDLEPLAADPETEGQRIADWAGALASEVQPGPYRLVRAPGAMTDMPDPWVSIGNLSTLRALSQRMGAALDPGRFRANLWLDGLAPCEEREWVGREIAIGPARLRVVEEIGRCRATEANPETGRRDADVPRALPRVEREAVFAVYAETLAGGRLSLGDPVSA